MTLSYDVMCEHIDGGFELYDGDETAILWDREIEECVRAGDGATPLTAVLLKELIHSKFEPDN